MGMTNAQKQQAYRDRKKAKLSPEVLEVNRQCDRLNRLLTDHPAMSSQFDVWMAGRNGEIKRRKV